MTRYGNRRIPGLREAVLVAIPTIIEAQTTDGGWYYSYDTKGDNDGRGDTSVAGWQIQALNAARYTRLPFPELDACWDKAISYIQKSQVASGAFGYRRETGARPSMTGIGALSLIIAKKDKGGEVRNAVRYLSENFTADLASGKDGETKTNIYGAYYVNQVLFMRGGSAWKKWNAVLNPEVLKLQRPDGSFNQEVGGDDGAAKSAAAGADAEIYRTALCTLMLEVYYRYLPATDQRQGAGDE
jgi:prenyltransferase beta subunit